MYSQISSIVIMYNQAGFLRRAVYRHRAVQPCPACTLVSAGIAPYP